jgi:surface carbohydrate biosynthesis protein
MSNRKLLMIIPYKARDLEGHALVGYHLRRLYGYDVVYSNGYGIESKLLQHAPDALVLDHLSWDFKVKQARLARELGMKVIVLPTEGLFQDREGAQRRAGKLHGATHVVDAYLAWGDYARDALLEQELMSEEQVCTVGCPRFDFYAAPYLSLMQTREDLCSSLNFANPYAPLVLWATNTSFASRNPQTMLHRQVRSAKKPAAEVRAHIEDHLVQFKEHSSLVMSLARRHPDWNFVIKVHPAEWINPYVALTKEAPNVRLAFNTPIRHYLYNCDVLLQRNCTTATEAWMLGKPVLNLEVGRYNRVVRDEYRSGNHPVTSLAEADEAVQQYIQGMPVDDAQQKARAAFIASFFYRIDGKSSERCAERIFGVLAPPTYGDDDQARTRRAVNEAYATWREAEDTKVTNRIKDLLGIDRTVSLRFWKEIFQGWKSNLDLFQPEVDITTDMVGELHHCYEQVLASNASERV